MNKNNRRALRALRREVQPLHRQCRQSARLSRKWFIEKMKDTKYAKLITEHVHNKPSLTEVVDYIEKEVDSEVEETQKLEKMKLNLLNNNDKNNEFLSDHDEDLWELMSLESTSSSDSEKEKNNINEKANSGEVEMIELSDSDSDADSDNVNDTNKMELYSVNKFNEKHNDITMSPNHVTSIIDISPNNLSNKYNHSNELDIKKNFLSHLIPNNHQNGIVTNIIHTQFLKPRHKLKLNLIQKKNVVATELIAKSFNKGVYDREEFLIIAEISKHTK